MTTGIGGLLLLMALVGPALVEFLYDDRYILSGPIVTLIALALLPQVIGMTYDPSALAAGDSRSYFVLMLGRAVTQVVCILTGIAWFGLTGAILGIGLGTVLAYPVLVWLSTKHRVWDPLHDLIGALLLSLGAILIYSLHRDEIALLSGL